MKKVFIISAAVMLLSGSAFAQSNMSGQDAGQSSGAMTTGSSRSRVAPVATGSEAGNNANSLSGSNSAASDNYNAVEGRTSGGGGGAGAGGSGGSGSSGTSGGGGTGAGN